MKLFGKDNLECILGYVKESQDNFNFCDIIIICQDGSINYQSFGLLAASSFWRELLYDKHNVEKICIICPEFKKKDLQFVLQIVFDGQLENDNKDKLKMIKIANTILPDLEFFDEENKKCDDRKVETEQIIDKHLTCKYCFKYFATEAECKNHTVRMHVNKDFFVICSICNGKFKTQTALDNHTKNIHSEHPHEYACTTCGKTYGYESDLRRHCQSKNHNFPKPKFNSVGNKEACQKCGKFVVNMKYHMNTTHTDDNLPFTCKKCNKEFDRKDSLRRHESGVHHMWDTNFSLAAQLLKVKTDKWQCKQCKKTFYDIKKLEDHLVLKDCTENICEYCPAKFKDKHNLTKHIQNIHLNNQPYICEICKKKFSTKSSLNRHLKSCS